MDRSYSVPGVYRHERFPRPPGELPTGVPAMIGLMSRAEIARVSRPEGGPASPDDPRLLLRSCGPGAWWVMPPRRPQGAWAPAHLRRWSEFADRYRPLVGVGYLADAVYGFFLNGGQICRPLVTCFEDTPAAALAAALELLAPDEALDLVCAPDIMRWPEPEGAVTLQRMLLDHCAALGDRFAILDAPPGPDLLRAGAHAEELESAHGAIYAPWLDIGLRPDGLPAYVPPSGHVAGVYARSDAAVGVHKAPANEPLEGVLDLQAHLTDREHRGLPQRLNCLRSLPGRGIRVWGARTLSREPVWAQLSVRRLFITAGRWLAHSMADVAFEPNDPLLWSQVERDLTAYCAGLFQRGALKGGTPAEAFYVRCDAETNPPAARERGELTAVLGLAPALPSEFIVVQIVHGASGVTLAAPAL